MLKALIGAKRLIFFILLFHLILLLTLKFTAWPEMTFWPYLILKGWFPYRDIAIAHTPLLLVDLTIFYKIFGLGLVQLKAYTWILILATDFLLFWVARRLWDKQSLALRAKKIALLAVLFYIPLQIFYGGNGLWFDLALAPLALAIYYNLERKNYLWAGIWWGAAFFTKQTAFWFLPPIAFTFLRAALKVQPLKGVKKFVIGAGLIGVVSFILLSIFGIWGDFWLWAIKFGITRLPASSGQIHFPTLRQFIIATLPYLALVLANLRLKKVRNLLPWAIFAAFGVFPRWELFHFQPALPFLAIGLGVVASNLSKLKSVERIALAISLLLFAVVVSRQLVRDFGGGTRFFEPEVLKVADYVRENTEKDDEIYVANAWDSLYVLTDTIPGTRPHVPYIPWYLEIPFIQDAMAVSLEISQPKLIVQGEYRESGLGSYKPPHLNKFIMENYKLTDKIDGYEIWRPK
ncbi:hypothetical protein A2V56_03425 [Candidatus Woesebacteria bacterium RBG_19FT_COMBO_42_9]|uniref:Glycosyltransferase RgtA/B/C/D-like domain-containing protein n=1 Tax=Candidatus Woesebacteria bacterium RBG_16_42_24 TaxID=1802485 RepID=A0A1F7XKK9_9BACT|nr:MAG: hypothetical protein A2V97_00815 [Candidatus Woesebacteria bacterium RBG_16_42_24]OGM16107.1 MAG: hypothetical protein A2V56_03425 [Candidatus Woesebacteria bacterium RBG_19FT_COMBO_42_9]